MVAIIEFAVLAMAKPEYRPSLLKHGTHEPASDQV